MRVDSELVDFIFESENNRKIFSKYLKSYFHELGDKFWSKYYVHHYHSLIPILNTPNTNIYTFAFYKINSSNYKSPIVHFDKVTKLIKIPHAFNKMQHYKCKPMSVSDIQIMFKKFKREYNIDTLLK